MFVGDLVPRAISPVCYTHSFYLLSRLLQLPSPSLEEMFHLSYQARARRKHRGLMHSSRGTKVGELSAQGNQYQQGRSGDEKRANLTLKGDACSETLFLAQNGCVGKRADISLHERCITYALSTVVRLRCATKQKFDSVLQQSHVNGLFYYMQLLLFG